MVEDVDFLIEAILNVGRILKAKVQRKRVEIRVLQCVFRLSNFV
jgi:hypothetical protein